MSKRYGPADVTCPYCGEVFHVEEGPTKLVEVTHCNDRWIVVDLEEGKAGHTRKFATDGGTSDSESLWVFLGGVGVGLAIALILVVVSL